MGKERLTAHFAAALFRIHTSPSSKMIQSMDEFNMY